MFIGLLASIINASNHTECIFLNQQCMIHPTLINLNPNEYVQRLQYYSFGVNVDKCMGSCNTLNDLSHRLYVPDKTEDFRIIRGINESRSLAKHISYKCRCKTYLMPGENVTPIKSGIMKHYQCKNYQMCKESYSWNSTTCICENGKYLRRYY